MRSPIMVLYIQTRLYYGSIRLKIELPNNTRIKPPMPIFNTCEAVCGILRKTFTSLCNSKCVTPVYQISRKLKFPDTH
jgi:hypothetical protein